MSEDDALMFAKPFLRQSQRHALRFFRRQAHFRIARIVRNDIVMGLNFSLALILSEVLVSE